MEVMTTLGGPLLPIHDAGGGAAVPLAKGCGGIEYPKGFAIFGCQVEEGGGMPVPGMPVPGQEAEGGGMAP